MKTNILRLLAFVAFLVVAAIGAANAQELPNPEYNGYQFQEPNAYDEKPLILESDLKYPKAARDTSSHSRTSQSHSNSASSKNSKAAAADPRKPASGGKGEDPLNFNFLYYIIQKFKTSDLIDQ